MYYEVLCQSWRYLPQKLTCLAHRDRELHFFSPSDRETFYVLGGMIHCPLFVTCDFLQKDSSKELSPFHKIVTKFLATNTLQSVCPWLADIVPQEVHGPQRTSFPSVGNPSPNSAASSGRPSFVYRPSLFTVTTRPLSTFVQLNPDPRAVQRHLSAPVGFFWETIETGDEGQPADCGAASDEPSADMQTTMSLIYKQVFYDPRAVMAILTRVLQGGLSFCGLRLLYPTGEQIEIGGMQTIDAGTSPAVGGGSRPSAAGGQSVVGPVLAVALRGAGARTVWLDVVGPSDPVLARRTDPNSLCALYGGDSREGCLIFCPRNPYRTASEIVRWFGGRVPASGVLCIGEPASSTTAVARPPSGGRTKKSSGSGGGGGSTSTDHLETPTAGRPVSTLVATTQSDVFLALSPLVPSKCFGVVLCICQRRGFRLKGVRRLQLNGRRATQLGTSWR
jgi:hypothetical protein